MIDGQQLGLIANVAADVTNYGDTGRSPNTTYQYRVRAENSEGNSAFATSNAVTTGDQVPPQISHSPISSGTSGQSLTISAIIVDNVKVQYVGRTQLEPFKGYFVNNQEAITVTMKFHHNLLPAQPHLQSKLC